MPSSIPVDSQEAHLTESVNLDNESYELELVWRPRSSTWHMSIRRENGDVSIVERKAIRPSVSFFKNHVQQEAPDGVLIIVGPEDYDRRDLGENLELVYFSADELVPSPPDRNYVIHKN